MATEQSEAVQNLIPQKIDTVKELSLAYSSVDQALHRIRRLSRAFPEVHVLLIASNKLEEVKNLLVKGKL